VGPADPQVLGRLHSAGRCRTSVPECLRQRFDGLDDNPNTPHVTDAHVAIKDQQRLRH
jgi:hypothetical protein